jgi:hypothetical protein
MSCWLALVLSDEVAASRSQLHWSPKLLSLVTLIIEKTLGLLQDTLVAQLELTVDCLRSGRNVEQNSMSRTHMIFVLELTTERTDGGNRQALVDGRKSNINLPHPC